MRNKRQALNAGFVIATILLSVLLTFFFCLRAAPVYEARLHFQIATTENTARPNLATEARLILSDSLLVQVLKDNNLTPPSRSASSFRSFDLGPVYKPPEIKGAENSLSEFKEKMEIEIYPDNAIIEIFYKSEDSAEALKIVEAVFTKYRDWRQARAAPVFSREIIDADKNLAQKREVFLQSQKDLLDFIESQATADKSPDDSHKQNELAAKIEALKLRYGPKHPVLIEALRQEQALKIAQTPQPDQGRLKILRDKMERDFQALDIAIRASVILEQEKNSNVPAFQILPLGEAEVHAASQYLAYKLGLAALAGLIVSLLYLQLRARIRPVFYTGDDLNKAFGYVTLGHIPGLLNKASGETPLPSGSVAEALKALRQEIKLRGSETHPVKLITVTSSGYEEGCAELIAGLGRLSARNREKVLILDADLRSPGLQKILPSSVSRNLVDYLSGQARLEDIIARSDTSGVHVIYGTAIPNTALDLLSSEKMKTLLHSLREVYDLVLVQAPAASRGPDSRVLASLSDQTLYLVRAGKTRRQDIQSPLETFKTNNIANLGFVLID